MPDLTVVDIANLATFLFLAAWASVAVLGILRGERHTICFVIVVHFILAALPLFLDLTAGQPEYLRYPGFYKATRSATTSYLYCAYVAACCPLWWWTARRRTRRHRAGAEHPAPPPSRWFRNVLRLFALSPIVLLFTVPDPIGTLSYFSGTTEVAGADAVGVESIPFRLLRASTFWSVLACAALFILYRKVNALTLFLTPLLVGLSIWIQGKRSIAAIAVTIFGYVLWDKGYLRGARLIVAVAVSAALFAGFSYWHLSTFRGFDLTGRGARAYYERARIDFGRDDVIKLAIYNELGGEATRTLDYRGQSLLFCATFFVPRTMWANKPWPYAVYVTAAAFEGPKRPVGSGFTTSVLEESIANFGWPGLLIGPLILSALCRAGDACRERWMVLLTTMVAILLLAVHLAAFIPLMLCWVFAFIWTTRSRFRYDSVAA